MSEIKGSTCRAAFQYLALHYGEDAIKRVKQLMAPKDVLLLFSDKILDSSWVDYPAYMIFMLTADQVLGKGDGHILEICEQAIARKNFGGIYKVFITWATPQFLLKRVSLAWKQIFKQGELSVIDATNTSARLRLRDFPGIPLHHEKLQNPYMKEILVMCGSKNVQVTHPQCIARGDDCCIFDFSWE